MNGERKNSPMTDTGGLAVAVKGCWEITLPKETPNQGREREVKIGQLLLFQRPLPLF